jgi:hypothetical protein
MVHSSQSTEARLDLAVGSVEGHAEVGIVGGYATLFVVGFEDGVAEVGSDDEDVNVASMRVVTGRARSRLGIASANGEAVVNSLEPACCKLSRR